MWLTRMAIQRPAYMLMAIGMLIFVGLFSWTKLNVDLFPSLDYPYVQVTTVYPGAGPEAGRGGGRRLRLRPRPEPDPRAERSVPGGHRVAGDRPGHRRRCR